LTPAIRRAALPRRQPELHHEQAAGGLGRPASPLPPRAATWCRTRHPV